ncbi:hypothetical protein D3C76_927720 [compost metagenome]
MRSNTLALPLISISEMVLSWASSLTLAAVSSGERAVAGLRVSALSGWAMMVPLLSTRMA